MTLSCPDLHLNELALIIRKLWGNIDDSDTSCLDYDSRCNEFNNNPVLLAHHFQERGENIDKEIIMNGHLGRIYIVLLRLTFKLEVVPMSIAGHDQIMSLN